jgi:hypothetical protein
MTCLASHTLPTAVSTAPTTTMTREDVARKPRRLGRGQARRDLSAPAATVTTTTESPGEIPRSGHRPASGKVTNEAAGIAGAAPARDRVGRRRKRKRPRLTAVLRWAPRQPDIGRRESHAFRRGRMSITTAKRRSPQSRPSMSHDVNNDDPSAPDSGKSFRPRSGAGEPNPVSKTSNAVQHLDGLDRLSGKQTA